MARHFATIQPRQRIPAWRGGFARLPLSPMNASASVKAFCSLSRKQAALYQQAVTKLQRRLEDVGGMHERGWFSRF